MMEVILREDVKSLGKAGEMVRVKPGYARNYLLPHGLAFEATEGNKKRIAGETRARGVRSQAERAEAERAAAELSAVTVTLTGKAGEEGKLFGSVTAEHIAAAIKAQSDVDIDRRDVRLDEPIRSIGTHEVKIHLFTDVEPIITVEVEPEG